MVKICSENNLVIFRGNFSFNDLTAVYFGSPVISGLPITSALRMEGQQTGMTSRYKAKNKKAPAKTKTPKKKKSDGPSCSLFLSELTKKLASRRKIEQEDPEPTKNIVNTIIETITNSLPVVLSKKSIEKKESPVKMEVLQSFAPELLPNDAVEMHVPQCSIYEGIPLTEEESKYIEQVYPGVNMPRMPIIISDVMKPALRKVPVSTHEIAVNTGGDHDVASEIAKHVNTLRRISLIAEEFNQKTAKNLKEIVDSVQEDLIKKLETIQAEQKTNEVKEMQIDQLLTEQIVE